MSDQFDPEAKDMLMQLMGQTYGELHKLDNFIVSPSQQLRPKSEEFKQTVANVTRSLNSNVPQQAVQIRTNAPVSVAVPVHADQTMVRASDPNQMEFGFDNSATAVAIDKSLIRIEDKVDKLISKLNSFINKSVESSRK